MLDQGQRFVGYFCAHKSTPNARKNKHPKQNFISRAPLILPTLGTANDNVVRTHASPRPLV
ncbi:MAG: hypothetical protein AAF911_01355 [Planctomycetota bacterium]